MRILREKKRLMMFTVCVYVSAIRSNTDTHWTYERKFQKVPESNQRIETAKMEY